MDECNCEICQFNRDYQKHLSTIENEEVRNFFEEVAVRLEAAETDKAYYHSILNGTWPNVEEVLEQFGLTHK